MESMLNKLRSSMSSAATSAVSNAVQIASQVSNYLPGNPVTREFEATAHVASAGPGECDGGGGGGVVPSRTHCCGSVRVCGVVW